MSLEPARLIRAFHDAVAGFSPPAGASWQVLIPAEGDAMLGRRTRSMHDFLAAGATDGLEPWARLWREGQGKAWRRDSEFIEGRAALWEQALLG